MAAAAAASTDMAPPTVTQNKHRAHRKHPMITPRGTGRLHPRRCPVSGDGSGTVVIGFAHASEQKRARRRSDTRRGSCQRPSLPSLCPVADGNCRDERAVLRCRRRPILHPNMAGRSRKIYIRTGDRPSLSPNIDPFSCAPRYDNHQPARTLPTTHYQEAVRRTAWRRPSSRASGLDACPVTWPRPVRYEHRRH